ncbi:unnamed protein product [Vicia faba]|uniref:Uncharacterized protein n=1 Tax=Vicia faba TaxID=3906 RepID=A0AAV1ARM5_VICFA|nr:unnamed protein product [Vicia faba]
MLGYFSQLITGVYSICDGPALSHTSFLGTKTVLFPQLFSFQSKLVFSLIGYRARRKPLFHHVDPEAVPHSLTPYEGRAPKSDNKMRWRPFGTSRDKELLARLLADSDNFFVTCQGLLLHYKLNFPGSPPHTLSSTSRIEPNYSYYTLSMAGG